MNISNFEDRIADAFEKNDIKALEKLKKESFTAIKGAKGSNKTFYVEAFKLLSASLLANELRLHDNFNDRITYFNRQIHGTVEKVVRESKVLNLKKIESNIAKDLNKIPIVVEANKKNEMTWTETPISGDGNCGFTATNTNREEVVAYLLKNSDKVDIRKLVAPEIKGWLLLSEYKKNELSKDLEQRLDQSVNDNTLDQTSMEKDVFEAYVNHYYKSGYLVVPERVGDSCATGVMNVIVEMKGTPIRIWNVNRNRPGEVYLHAIVGDVTNENMGKTLDVIQKGGAKHEEGNHFNKLRGKPRVVVLGSTEQYNPI